MQSEYNIVIGLRTSCFLGGGITLNVEKIMIGFGKHRWEKRINANTISLRDQSNISDRIYRFENFDPLNAIGGTHISGI